jgi:hypothetical protein
MIDLLLIDEKLDRDFMLAAAEHAADHQGPDDPSPVTPDEPLASNASLFSLAWRAAIERSLRQLLAQDEAWEVRAIQLLRAGMDRMSADRLLLALLPPAAWWLAYWLVTPMLSWPLEEATLSQTASIQFGVATWLIPLLLTVFLVLQPSPDGNTSGLRSQPARLLLQFTGSLVGFVSVAVTVAGLGLAWYYFRGSPLPQGVGWGLALFPILTGYVAGRGVPVLRGRSEQRYVFGKGDVLVLVVFLLLGPAAAIFFYHERTMLQEQTFGVLLLLVLLGWSMWEARDRLPQPLVVLLLGVAAPGLVLCLPLWMPGAPGAQNVDPQTLLLFTGYIIGQCTIVVTLYVREKAKLIWPALVFLLLMELLTVLVLVYDTAWGLRFLLGLGVLMLALGLLGQRPPLQQYLHIHASFWVMQLVFMVSVWAWGTALGWTSIFFFGGATVGLLLWAGDIRPIPAARSRGRLSTG